MNKILSALAVCFFAVLCALPVSAGGGGRTFVSHELSWGQDVPQVQGELLAVILEPTEDSQYSAGVSQPLGGAGVYTMNWSIRQGASVNFGTAAYDPSTVLFAFDSAFTGGLTSGLAPTVASQGPVPNFFPAETDAVVLTEGLEVFEGSGEVEVTWWGHTGSSSAQLLSGGPQVFPAGPTQFYSDATACGLVVTYVLAD